MGWREDMDESRRDRDETYSLIDAYTGAKQLKRLAQIKAARGDIASMMSKYDDARRFRASARATLVDMSQEEWDEINKDAPPDGA